MCLYININIYLYTCIEMCTWHKEEKKKGYYLNDGESHGKIKFDMKWTLSLIWGNVLPGWATGGEPAKGWRIKATLNPTCILLALSRKHLSRIKCAKCISVHIHPCGLKVFTRYALLGFRV